MKTTIKSINAHLAPVTYYARHYILHDFSGVMPEDAEYLGTVVAEYDSETGECTGIYDYATGDAMQERHYYGRDCVDITSIIEDWIKPAPGYRDSRREILHEIQTAIANAI